MSAGEVRKVTSEELQKVKSLIELCISRYMMKNQVIDILYQQHNIEPIFTKIVWERLEEANPQFFQSYLLSLILKDQITQFNHLIRRQATLMHQLNTHGVVSNGSHIPAMHHSASYYIPENNCISITAENTNMRQFFPEGGFNNGGPAYIPPSDMQPAPLNMVFAQNSNGVAFNGHGDGMGNSRFVDEGNGGVLESNPAVSSFGMMDSIPYINQFVGTLTDDTRSSQLLRQFSHDINPPYLTAADFNSTTDTLRFEPYVPRELDKRTMYNFQDFSRY